MTDITDWDITDLIDFCTEEAKQEISDLTNDLMDAEQKLDDIKTWLDRLWKEGVISGLSHKYAMKLLEGKQ